MTVYSVSRNDVVQRAQETLDAHVPAADTGRCLTCEEMDCPHREEAVRVFSRYLLLPSRRPGASRPERMTLRRRH